MALCEMGFAVARGHRGVRLGRPARRSGRRVPVQHERRQHRRGVHPRVRDDQRIGAPDSRRVDLPGEERRARARRGRAGLLRRAAPCCSERRHEARPRRAAGPCRPSMRATRDFFTAGVLTLQQCNACKHIQHPPEDVCEACRSFELGPLHERRRRRDRERRGGDAGRCTRCSPIGCRTPSCWSRLRTRPGSSSRATSSGRIPMPSRSEIASGSSSRKRRIRARVRTSGSRNGR